MAAYLGPREVSNGVVLDIDASDANSYSGSGTSWKDISGNNNSLVLTNSPTFSSSGGGYFTFTAASSQYALVNNNILNPTTFPNVTQAIWFYPTSAGQIVSELGQSVINTSWHDANIEINSSGVFYFSLWQGNYTAKVTSAAQSFNNWYYLVLSYSGTTLTAYINGAAIGTATFTRSTNTVLYYALCANDATNMTSTAYAGGRIASFSVYNWGLTTTEVLQNFNAKRRRFNI